MTAISFAFSACGGGDTEQEKGLLALPQEPGTETPDPTLTPTPTVSPSPGATPTPSVSATPTPTLSPTATPDPGNGAELSKPSLSVEVVGGAISANWSDADAEGYRLIYWPQDRVTPQEASVSGTSHETEALRSAWYLVMVEAYDAFGNGLFSDPVYVEVP